MVCFIAISPLIGFLINGLWYGLFQTPVGAKKTSSKLSGGIASLCIAISFVFSLSFFIKLLGLPPNQRIIEQTLFSWISVGSMQLDFGLRLDTLSSVFCLVITGVGTLIHIYSIGYMNHDATPAKFFAFLNLFCFAMLVLVLGSSLPVLFLGWEGVGLCSYLLIGYWYQNYDNAIAGKKAFVVNRIGDLGFLLGMFLLYSNYQSFDFLKLASLVPTFPVESGVVTSIAVLLFIGCMGKSAQIPLYVWLPDAMAGPTPVSALIHAATMVTSGIYLVARMGFLFRLSETAMAFIAITGAVTALFAATIALCQKDIKKVLAYSTVSQLGYMFLGCGVGAFGAGVFHVMTHAFFKALLFLGAGSVIHGMHEQQDICKMGGLRSKMPKTFLTFAVGWAAICGLPPLSGFFSKDEILWRAFSSTYGSFWLWSIGAITAVLTAFYMTRLFYLVFLGTPRFDEKNLGNGLSGHLPANLENVLHIRHATKGDPSQGKHQESRIHESSLWIIVPLQVLAVLSVLGGCLGIPHIHWGLETWLEPIFGQSHEIRQGVDPALEWLLMGVSVAGAVLGISMALTLYRNLKNAKELSQRAGAFYQLIENKWYVDEVYEFLFVRPVQALSQVFWRVIDVAFIDWIVVGLGRGSQWSGQCFRILQNGSVQFYSVMLLVGILASVGYLLYGLAY